MAESKPLGRCAMIAPMDRPWDVIVLGLGAMGSAALWHLAKRGARVLGIEQFSRAHALGSSHGGSRIFRTAYFEHADYVPLLRRAALGWSELERESSTRLMHKCGVLYGGLAGSAVIAGVRESARLHGIDLETISPSDLGGRFPAFAGCREPLTDFVFEPGAGFIRPEWAILAFLKCAEQAGACVRDATRVRSWEECGEGVTVLAGERIERAKKLVICGGPWAPALVPQLGVELVNTREVIGWVAPRNPAAADEQAMPAFFMERIGGDPMYGIPTARDQESPQGVKIGVHGRGRVCDPDAMDRVVTERERLALEQMIGRIAPNAAGRVTDSAVCIYTNTPDDHFVIDRLRNHERVTVAAGFCGHGFKFAPVVGEIVADLALDGITRLPADFLRANRFESP